MLYYNYIFVFKNARNGGEINEASNSSYFLIACALLVGCINIVVPEGTTVEPTATVAPKQTAEPSAENNGVSASGQTIYEFIEY